MPTSSTGFIEETAKLVMQAFREFGVEADQVLLYDDLFSFLDQRARHHRDWLRDAEHVLAQESLVTPDPAGLRLTEVGHRTLYNRNA